MTLMTGLRNIDELLFAQEAELAPRVALVYTELRRF
jgi:hypothetical protein